MYDAAILFARLPLILPDLLLGFGAVAALLLGAFCPNGRRGAIGLGTLVLLGYLVATGRLLGSGNAPALFWGSLATDDFACYFKLLFGMASLVTLAFLAKAKEMESYGAAELVAFLLAVTLGMSMMAASTDLLMMYLSLETVSVLSYILVGFKRRSRVSTEAGLKYLLYGAFASGIMIFGLSYLYGMVGSSSFVDVANHFRHLEGISSAPVVLFALLCTMMGIGFKIATFPTQMWCPDVYEGAATPVTAFLSVGPKAAGFAMLLRFFFTAFDIHAGKGVEIFEFIHWGWIVAILSALTMTIGNVAAIPQRNLKRLMAYSSIAHAGYLLMGFTALTQEAVSAMLLYLFVYLLMNLGAFLVILAVADRIGSEEIEAYRGLGYRSPFLGVILAIFLFSLTGLPPFAGFLGKFYLFAVVISAAKTQPMLYVLAVIAVINTVISLFYYARILRVMYLETPLDRSAVPVPMLYRAIGLALAIPTVLLLMFLTPMSGLIGMSAASLF